MSQPRKVKAEPDEESKTVSTVRRSRQKKSKRSWTRALLSIGARLAIWYSLVVAIFYCPTSEKSLSHDSPAICKPYLQGKAIALPHLSPYYDAYAAPYVDYARPYVATAYTKVYEPSAEIVKRSYASHGAPRVAQLQRYSEQEWSRIVKPRIEDVRTKITNQYDASLEPYLAQVSGLAGPYYCRCRDAAVAQYHSLLLPTYERTLPYAQHAFDRSYVFVKEVGMPYAKTGTEVVYVFLTRKLWPPLRVLYGENVQPQLVKIRERLANYRGGKRIESSMEELASPAAFTEVVESTTSIVSATAESSSSSTVKTTTATEAQATEPAKKQSLAEELNAWKAKFTKAADRGAEELRERVSEIASRQVDAQVKGTGEALIIQLEESVNSALGGLKSSINNIVESLPEEENEDDEEKATKQAHDKIRAAGKSVKQAAQKLRSWKLQFHEDTEGYVRDATDSTLDMINHIRDLGLQDIGMRWANQDDASYKEWSEYRALKKSFDTWRSNVEDAAMKHEGLTSAKREGEDIESRGMAIAEDAAIELSRLKNVALWKIRSKDSSDDFSSRIASPRIAKVKEQVAEKISDASEAIYGTSQGTVESVTSAAAGATSGPSSASSIAETLSSSATSFVKPLASNASSIGSAASDKIAESVGIAAGSASSVVVGGAQKMTDAVSTDNGIVSSASSSAKDAASSASTSGGKLSSSASKSAGSVSSVASRSVSSGSSSVADKLAEKSADVNPNDIESMILAKREQKMSAKARLNSLLAEHDPSVIAEARSKATESAESIWKEIRDKASETANQASATIVPSASSMKSKGSDMVGDTAKTASSSLQSVVGEAGAQASEVTKKLTKSGSSAAKRATADEL